MSRDIPNTNEIEMYLHCDQCLSVKPKGISPECWSDLSVGYTVLGIQVWCNRCKVNVIHIDFEGQKHYANIYRPKNIFEKAAEAQAEKEKQEKRRHLSVVKSNGNDKK